METLYCRRLFSVGGADYRAVDVVLGATLWGEWARLHESARQALACVRHAEAMEDHGDPDEVESAANEFRYARDLVTAEETHAWLREWGLTAEAWMDSIERSVLRRRWAAELPDLAARYPVSDEEVSAALAAEAICSGELARLAEKLAGRAAIYDGQLSGAAGDLGEPSGAEVSALLLRVPASARERGLSPVPPERCLARTRHVAHLEGCFERFRRAALTPAAVRAHVDAHGLDWILVECRYLAFAEAEAAREAALCVREDGRELEAVAADAGTVVREARWFLDTLSPGARSHFVAARKGDLLDPLPFGDEVRLCLVLDKRMPSDSDPEVRQRAEEGVVARLVEQEVARRVRWHVRW